MAGKDYRKGISLTQLFKTFPDEQAAQDWFESARWQNGRACPKCESDNTRSVKNAKPMPYWRTDCRSYFSVTTGTAMQSSRLPLRKWAIAICQMRTSLEGVSSMKLHRDLGITQKSAWYMARRIRKAMDSGDPMFGGSVEADESYFGGVEANKRESERSKRAGIVPGVHEARIRGFIRSGL